MSTIDIFYRRDMIMESLDLDLLPLTEGIGSNIANAFNRIRKAISNFFKNLIDRIKNLFKKNRKESSEINKKISREEAIEIARKSDKKFKTPVNELNSADDALEVLDFINDDMPKIYEKFKDLSFIEFKENFLNEVGIGSIDNIDDFISSYFFTGKKITKVSDIDMNVLLSYGDVDEQENVVKAIQLSRNKLMKKLDNFEKECKREDSEYTEENIKKIKFLYNTQIKCIEKTIKYFQMAGTNNIGIMNNIVNIGKGEYDKNEDSVNKEGIHKSSIDFYYHESNLSKEKDLDLLREKLKNSIYADRRCDFFIDLVKLAYADHPDLFVEHDGKPFILNKNDWDLDYFTHVAFDLANNFSIERVKHIVKVSRYVNRL